MTLKMYRWKGVNSFQQAQKGILIGENEHIVRQQLLQKGIKQLKIQQNWQLSTRPRSKEIYELLLQLSILLKSSLPLKNSLLILLENCHNLQLNQWIRNLLQSIEAGLSLSQATEHYPQFLSFQERQLIYVGELSGKLVDVMAQIAANRQKSIELQQKLQKIMLYPAMVLVVSLSLTVLLLIFVVPQFAEMYANNQAELPFFTQVLLTASDILRHYFIFMFFCVFIFFIGLKYLMNSSPWLYKQKIKLSQRMPVLGNVVFLARLVNFSRGLHVMLYSGVPLNQALQSFIPQKKSWQKKTKQQGDPVLIQEVQQMLHWLTQGYPFSVAVGATLFPVQAQQMLQVGEQSGQLTQMLKYIEETYQQQLEHKIDLLSQMLEPMLMVIIGGLIGLIMLGMYMPIFNMGAVIQ
ncbi:type II secretion system F family protein [Pasteurellaceae bacterium 22721_9_1]